MEYISFSTTIKVLKILTYETYYTYCTKNFRKIYETKEQIARVNNNNYRLMVLTVETLPSTIVKFEQPA